MLAPDAEAEESITASGHRRWCRRPSVEHSCPGLSHSAPRLTVFLAPDSMSRPGPRSDFDHGMNLISQITTKLSVSTERLHLWRLNSGIRQPITVDQNKTVCLLIGPRVHRYATLRINTFRTPEGAGNTRRHSTSRHTGSCVAGAGAEPRFKRNPHFPRLHGQAMHHYEALTSSRRWAWSTRTVYAFCQSLSIQQTVQADASRACSAGNITQSNP